MQSSQNNKVSDNRSRRNQPSTTFPLAAMFYIRRWKVGSRLSSARLVGISMLLAIAASLPFALQSGLARKPMASDIGPRAIWFPYYSTEGELEFHLDAQQRDA
ncbi:MAG: hypothetical protein M3Y84_01350 [Acidobacteriota bacterium]|nr:hypothetical protein [Acidobacteriota bacterium]